MGITLLRGLGKTPGGGASSRSSLNRQAQFQHKEQVGDRERLEECRCAAAVPACTHLGEGRLSWGY